MPRKSGQMVPGPGAKVGLDGTIQYNEMNIRQNLSILEYSRTFQAAASGGAAGILGLTSLYGFIFYIICLLIQSPLWYAKAGGDCQDYFLQKGTIVSYSVLGGLFTYVLFWTFLYGMVHVY